MPDDGRLARIDLASRQTDKDENVNGKRGILRNKREGDEEEASSSSPSKQTNSSSGIRDSFKVRILRPY